MSDNPVLRFKKIGAGSFPDWKKCKLGDILTERKTNQTISRDAPLLSFTIEEGVINPADKKTNKRDFLIKDISTKKFALTEVDDIIYNPANLKFGAIHRNKLCRGVVSPIYPIFYTDQNPAFVEYIVTNPAFIKRTLKYVEGTVIKLMTLKPRDFLKMEVRIPCIEEQNMIAHFMETLDEKINKTKKTIEELRKLESSCKEALSKTYNYKKIAIDEFLIEKNKKSTVQDQYPVLSSTVDGVYLQSEYFDKNIASTNNVGYKIVEKNDIIISPQNLWMGNISFNSKFEKGIVSPSYKIFEVKSGFDFYFIKSILTTKRAFYSYLQVSEQGASIVRRNMNYDAFMQLVFKVPTPEKQKKISDLFEKIEKRIELEEELLNALLNEKKYFWRELF